MLLLHWTVWICRLSRAKAVWSSMLKVDHFHFQIIQLTDSFPCRSGVGEWFQSERTVYWWSCVLQLHGNTFVTPFLWNSGKQLLFWFLMFYYSTHVCFCHTECLSKGSLWYPSSSHQASSRSKSYPFQCADCHCVQSQQLVTVREVQGTTGGYWTGTFPTHLSI